jgi:hypothetical protein
VWGDARTWRGFWWVVSAQTFAEKAAVVHGHASPWDLPFLPIEELGSVFALLAPAGAYFLLRRAASRVAGVALLVGAAGRWQRRWWAGWIHRTPIFAATWDRPSPSSLFFRESRLAVGIAFFRVQRLRSILVLVFLAGALTRFPTPAIPGTSSRPCRRLHETRALLADLPPRTALFTHHFETGFLVGYQRFVEGARPDVAWTHLAFAAGPGYAERAALARPELGPVIGAAMRKRGLAEQWTKLDDIRPVRIEPDAVTPPDGPPVARARGRVVGTGPKHVTRRHGVPAHLGAGRGRARSPGTRLSGLAPLHRRGLVVRTWVSSSARTNASQSLNGWFQRRTPAGIACNLPLNRPFWCPHDRPSMIPWSKSSWSVSHVDHACRHRFPSRSTAWTVCRRACPWRQ